MQTESETSIAQNARPLATQPLGRLMRRYAVPCMTSLVVAALYNMVDQVFIANAPDLGSVGNAATTVVFPLTVAALAIAVMLGDGCCAFVSLMLGAGKQEEAHRAVGETVTVSVLAGLVLMAAYLLFPDTLLTWFGGRVNAGTFEKAQEYFFWIALGVPLYVFGQAMNPVIRSGGSPTFAMVATLAGAAANLVLDPLLIFVFNMGIAGASIATAISQLTSFVILLVMCSTHADAITIHPRNYRPTKQMYAKILNNGLPSLGRQGIMSVSTSLLNNAAAVYGDPAIAAFAIVSRCLNFVNSTVVGFGQGFQPVCGFNYGARKYDRMHRAFSFSVKVTTIVLLVLGAAGFAFAEPVVTLFRRSDPEVIRIGTETFRIQILTVWAWGFITLSNMYTQAIGYGIRSTILAAARQGLFLIPTLLVLPNVWGLRGLEVCQPLADVLTLALAVWMMTKVIRAQKAQMAQETA